MQDPTYPVFPIFAFIGFSLGLVPLPWHLQAWNAGTCAYMMWTSLACLVEFINAIVWRDTALNLAPAWCDISSKFLLGAGIGIPASSLCISRRLYSITTVQRVSITAGDKRRALIGDLLIAVGIPVLIMILHYIVQGHRFDIIENIGCYPVIFNTLPAYFLVVMWPVVLGSVSFVFSAFTLRAFWKRRIMFHELLSSTTSLSVSRYMRLMVLASTEMACTIPIGIYSIYIDTKNIELQPWVSWAETHFNFSDVELVPSVIWRSDPTTQTAVELNRWLYPACAFLFFALFGFADEAQRNYCLVFWWVAGRLGFKRPPGPGFGLVTPWEKKDVNTPTSATYSLTSSADKKRHPPSFASSLHRISDFDVEKFASQISPPPSSLTKTCSDSVFSSSRCSDVSAAQEGFHQPSVAAYIPDSDKECSLPRPPAAVMRSCSESQVSMPHSASATSFLPLSKKAPLSLYRRVFTLKRSTSAQSNLLSKWWP